MQLTGGILVERTRLDDEEKQARAMSQEDIVKYYKLNADRGDVQSQVGGRRGTGWG